jgi:hypothetical protein
VKSAEELEIATLLKFRVTPVGNRKIEFLDVILENNVVSTKVRSTRPASVQEQEMWDHMLGLREQLSNLGWTPDSGMLAKPFLPGGGGVPTEEVRDSLGNPRE